MAKNSLATNSTRLPSDLSRWTPQRLLARSVGADAAFVDREKSALNIAESLGGLLVKIIPLFPGAAARTVGADRCALSLRWRRPCPGLVVSGPKCCFQGRTSNGARG